jgi:ubiquinone/menaquinone biosynthesis C-methylase UbiE
MRFEGRPKAVAVAEVLLCSSVPTQYVVGALLGAAGWLPFDSIGQLSVDLFIVEACRCAHVPRQAVSGLELSAVSLELAKKRFKVFGLKGRLLQVNAEEMDIHLLDEQFDLIYSFGVIHHSTDPCAIVAAARRLIGPTGEMRIMVYAKNSWKNYMIEAGLDQPEAQSGCPIALTYTEDEVRHLLRSFEILSLQQAHIFPYVVQEYIKYRYHREPWFESMPENMFKTLERKLGWHMLVKARPA